MSLATNSEAPTELPKCGSSLDPHDAPHGRKRARLPPYPPFVSEYRPYSNGQLQANRVNRPTDLHKRQWDMYYRNNTVNGYKDRHYILREFHELRAAIDTAVVAGEKAPRTNEAPSSKCVASTSPACSFSWMEAGCGVGNAILPVFAQYGYLPQWRALLGFDISPVAIALLEEKRARLPPALATKMHVCVLNPCESEVLDSPLFAPKEVGVAALTSSSLNTAGAGGVDGDNTTAVDSAPVFESPEFVSLIFVLCSIPVSSHAVVLSRIARCMARPGGVLYFRDYAVSDHAELRFQASLRWRRGDSSEGDGSDTGDTNTYERTNGTLSHFFSLEEARTLFEGAGFEVVALEIITNEVTNRKTSVSFARRFVQGRFRLRA
ncbi:Methyltransferase domain containing protein [Leishmania braziliensis]|nr:Methyltransferase domain containing protein [Leishmania braziliensis]